MRSLLVVISCAVTAPALAQSKPIAPAAPPVPADVPTYPRVVQRGTQVCLQQLDDKGAVTEECREETPRVVVPKPDLAQAPSLSPGNLEVRYYPLQTALALHSAQTKYGWSIAAKVVALPSLVGGTGLTLSGLVSRSSNRGALIGTGLAAVVGGAIFGVIAHIIDTSAEDDVTVASIGHE